MRLLFFCLILFLSQPFAIWAQEEVLDQKISVHLKQANLEEVFQKIESKLNVKFSYAQKTINTTKLNYKFKNEPLRVVLNAILKPSNLTYTLMYGNIIVITNLNTSTPKFNISGYVYDQETGEKLIGALVYNNRTFQSCFTNQDGYFTMQMPKDSIYLNIEFVGFEMGVLNTYLDKNLKVDIGLIGNLQYSPKRVTGAYGTGIESRSDGFVLNSKTIRRIPLLFGESDVLKSLLLLPGVISGNDGTTSLNIRGGGSEHNLILLDDVPVYNASHLYGFFSIFNADVVKSVKLIKGGMEARYSGRLSSVVDVRTIDGNKNKFKAQLSIGLLSSKISLDGPIGKSKKTTFFVAARRTYFDIIGEIFNLSNTLPVKTSYFFYDINGKVSHRFNASHQLSIAFYNGNDNSYVNNTISIKNPNREIKEKDKQNIFWGNQIMSIRYHHVWHPKLTAWLNLSRTAYNFGNENSYQYSENTDSFKFENTLANSLKSSLNDWILSYNLEYKLNKFWAIKAGVGAIQHNFSRRIKFIDDNNVVPKYTDNTLERSQEFNSYFDVKYDFKNLFLINAGFQLTTYSINKNVVSLPQPRLSLMLPIVKRLQLNSNYQRTTQFLHLLTGYNLGIPLDLWLPSTQKAQPEFSDAFSVDLNYAFRKFDFRVGVFKKFLYNVIDYKDQSNYLGTTSNWDEKIEVGKGWAKGLELMFEKKVGKTNGWMSYTLSKSERQFSGINNGNVFPFKFDRRHQFAVLVNHQVNQKFDFFVTWTYASGSRITLPETFYNITDPRYNRQQIYIYGERNKYQMPDNHRLDFGVNYKRYFKTYSTILSVGVYNAYNRFNPFYVLPSYNSKGERIFEGISLFPILPSVNYKITF
ncbi:MAG: TonB-dependent receptor plug domain-containing protein [Bacteroidota bacterium]|nr:TonB-dependent receptor plug domain-containing protein [Bacteroidota bacterium]